MPLALAMSQHTSACPCSCDCVTLPLIFAAEGTVNATVCGKCNSAAEFLAHSWSEIFLKAVAEAEVHLEASANGNSITAASNAFVESIAEATVSAYAQVSPETPPPPSPTCYL